MEVGNFKEKFYKVWNYESQFMIKLGLINFQHPGSPFIKITLSINEDCTKCNN